MGFLQSPMALIRILKDKDAVDSSSLQQTAQWFMSGEGRAAYTAANTLLKKTEYFFDYLQTVAKSKENRSFLYKLAFVMADAMDKSSLEFAGYPNILDASKNPLVAYVASEIITDESEYFKREDSTLEEDFFVRTADHLIPVEVKAKNSKSKSLAQLIKSDKYSDISYGIKFCAGNIGLENNIYTFPYYCTFLLKRYLKEV